MPTIKEIAQTVSFQGSPSSKQAELRPKMDLPVIDNSDPVSRRANISTSIDCFVAGEYVGGKGQRLQVTQRYTIFVSYSAQTQVRTMQEVRTRIMSDFQGHFGQFNITTVYVPNLVTPQIPIGPEDEAFYHGSALWKTRISRSSFDISTEREKSTRNITSIKRRYNL